MGCIILILIGLIYLATIFKSLLGLFQINVSLRKLNKFTSAYDKKEPFQPGNEKYIRQLNSLLEYYPVIQKYVPSPELSYHKHDSTNRENSEYLYKEFLMLRNYKNRDFLCSLFGINAIRCILNFPFYILSRLGFRPNHRSRFTINFIGIFIEALIAYLLDHFYEIASFIKGFIKP